MKMYSSSVLLFVIAFGILRSANAREENYTYTSLKFFNHDLVAQPVPYGCSNVFKDSYGFLWISTIDGVSIYNGNSFTHVPAYAEKENYFLGNSPHTFLQLDRQRMLIACTSGLYVFFYNSREVIKLRTAFPVSKEDRVGIVASDSVRKRIAVKADSIVYIFNYRLKELKRITCHDDDEAVVVRQKETCSSIFYCTKGRMLMAMDINSGHCDSLMPVSQARQGIAINEERKGMYMVVSGTTLTEIDARSKKEMRRLQLPLHNGTHFKPTCATKDIDGNFWIGGHYGLFIYFPDSGKLIPARRVSDQTGMDEEMKQTVNDIVIDRDGAFISTGEEGLLVLESRPMAARNYPLKRSISSLYVQGGKLYCALAGGGIARFTIGDTEHPDFFTSDARYGEIQYMEALDSTHIWVQFKHDLQIGIMDLKRMVLVHSPLPFDGIIQAYAQKTEFRYAYTSVRPIIVKVNTGLYYLSVGADLYKVSGTVRSGFTLSHAGAVSPGSVITEMFCRHPHGLMVATNRLELYSLINEKLVVKYRPAKTYNIPIWELDIDRAGNIYSGTPVGLYIFDSTFRLKTHLDEQSIKMMDSWINSVALDRSGMLWLSSLDGLMAYNTATHQLLNFPTGRFMQSPHFWIKSMAKDSAGNIFFGGSNGVVMLPSSSPSLKPRYVKLYFDEITNSGNTLYSGILPQSLVAPEPFAYDQNTFTFKIGGINFQQTTGLEYKYIYKLEGFDDTWHLPGSDNQISYMNLSAGHYKLIVRELNPVKPGKTNEIFYAFTILNPFWKTLPFIILVAFATIALIVFIIVFINRRQMEHERIRTSKLIALKAERERISQELHDDLGSGLTSIRLLTKAIVAKKGSENFTDMMNAVGEISGELIDQMSEIIWVLNHIDDSFEGLLVHFRNYVAAYLERISLNMKLEFSNSVSREFNISGTVRRNLLLVVKEIFHNVIKHSGASKLTVDCREEGNMIILTIADNGAGFSENEVVKGHGITNIKKRIETINGQVQFENKNGTVITISILKNNLVL